MKIKTHYKKTWGFPGGIAVKNPPDNAEDAGSIPASGRSPGEGNDNPLQYSCLLETNGKHHIKCVLSLRAMWEFMEGVIKPC